jgi:hypothetical protein
VIHSWGRHASQLVVSPVQAPRCCPLQPESGDGVRTRNDATTQAATALNRLVLERIVLSYAIGFQSGVW